MKRQVFDSLVITIKHNAWFGDRRILTLNLIWKHHLVIPYAVKEMEFRVNFNNFSFGLSMKTKADCDAININ